MCKTYHARNLLYIITQYIITKKESYKIKNRLLLQDVVFILHLKCFAVVQHLKILSYS